MKKLRPGDQETCSIGWWGLWWLSWALNDDWVSDRVRLAPTECGSSGCLHSRTDRAQHCMYRNSQCSLICRALRRWNLTSVSSFFDHHLSKNVFYIMIQNILYTYDWRKKKFFNTLFTTQMHWYFFSLSLSYALIQPSNGWQPTVWKNICINLLIGVMIISWYTSSSCFYTRFPPSPLKKIPLQRKMLIKEPEEHLQL